MSGFINDASSKVGSVQSFDDINIKTDTVLVNNTKLDANFESLNTMNGNSNDLVDLTDLIGENKALYINSNNNVDASETIEIGSLTKEEYQSELKKVEDYYKEQLAYLNDILSNPNKAGLQDQLDEINDALKVIDTTEARSIYNTNTDLNAFLKKTIPNVMEKYGINSYQELVDLQKTLNDSVIQLNEQIKTINNQKESAKYDYLDYLKDYNDYKEKGIDNNKLQKLDSEATITYTTEISDDKMTKNYSYREYKKLYPDVTPLEFYNLVKEKNKDGRFVITGIEEYTTFQYLMEIKDVAPELVKRYDYLSSISQEEADEFLRKCAYEINSVKGQLEAKEFLDSLNGADEKTILAALNNEFDVHKQGLADGVVSFLEGLLHTADASASLIEKLGNKIGFIEEAAHENRVMAPSEYKKMYILQALQSGEYKGLALSNNYEISQGIGNMLPSIAISAFTPYGSIAMGASGGGNAYHGSMVQGHSFFSSIVNGLYSGTSEAITERLFGGLPGLSEVQVTGLKSYLKAAVKEGNSEALQEVLDSLYQAAFMGEKLPTTFEEWKEYAAGLGKSWVYGGITAGYTQLPSLIGHSIGRHYAQAKTSQEPTSNTTQEATPAINEEVNLSDAATPEVEVNDAETTTIEKNEFVDSTEVEPTSSNQTEVVSLDEEVNLSDAATPEIEAEDAEAPTIENKEYTDSAPEETVNTNEAEEPTIEQVQYRNEDSDVQAIKDNLDDNNIIRDILKNKTSEEIETILNNPDMQKYINEMGQHDRASFVFKIMSNMDSNIDTPPAILEIVTSLDATYLGAVLKSLNVDKPLIDLNNPNNMSYLHNVADIVRNCDSIAILDTILNGVLFDPNASQVDRRIEMAYEYIKQQADYQKQEIIENHLKKAGYINKINRRNTITEFLVNYTIDGEERSVTIPTNNGNIDFYQLFSGDPGLEYQCKIGNLKIKSVEATGWTLDADSVKYEFAIERYGQEYDDSSRPMIREIMEKTPYKIEVEGKNGTVTLFDVPSGYEHPYFHDGLYVHELDIEKLLNDYGIDYTDAKIKVSKADLSDIKFEYFEKYLKSKTYDWLFDEKFEYGGAQRDVAEFVDRYFKGESKTNTESTKAKILVDEVSKFFPDATPEQISDIAVAYKEVGCGYMAYANSLMLFFGNLENGEALFREKFGYDLYVSNGLLKSYNVEALAFDLYLQEAAGISPDINIAMEKCDGTYKNGTADTNIFNYLKSKGIETEARSTYVVNRGNKLAQTILKLANSSGFFHILSAEKFSLYFPQYGEDVDYDSNNDQALKSAKVSSKSIDDIGSHGMLITGLSTNGLDVSSWKYKFLFPVKQDCGFRINSYKYKLEGGK